MSMRAVEAAFLVWTCFVAVASLDSGSSPSGSVELDFLIDRYGLVGFPTSVPILHVDFGYDYGPLWSGRDCKDTSFDLDETYHPPAVKCPSCSGNKNFSVVLIGLDDPGKDPLGRKGWGKSPLLHWAISHLKGETLNRLREYDILMEEGKELAEYRHPYPKFGCQRYIMLATEEPDSWKPPDYEFEEMPRRNWPLQQWADIHNLKIAAATCFQTCHVEDEEPSGTCSAS